jgi:tRNA (guanine37-N1)-methyltransferase
MRIDILTLFPDLCDGFMRESIIGRARKNHLLEIHCHDIRDYTPDKHRRVDDYPYGGGKGMVMQAEPISAATRHCAGKPAQSRIWFICRPKARP